MQSVLRMKTSVLFQAPPSCYIDHEALVLESLTENQIYFGNENKL